MVICSLALGELMAIENGWCWVVCLTFWTAIQPFCRTCCLRASKKGSMSSLRRTGLTSPLVPKTSFPSFWCGTPRTVWVLLSCYSIRGCRGWVGGCGQLVSRTLVWKVFGMLTHDPVFFPLSVLPMLCLHPYYFRGMFFSSLSILNR